MRIIRFVGEQGGIHRGVEVEPGVGQVYSGDLVHGLEATERRVKITRMLAPLQPASIFCVGLNYRAHAAESNSPIPEYPVLFMKPTTSVTNPGDPIRIPACCTHGPEVDYECELAVVIGQEARNVDEATALDHVFGYTVANDVSARLWQRNNGGQWVRGKGFDTFCPLGPAVVTRDEIPDPQTLRLRTTLNGQVMQDSNTADMIFTVARIVSFISQDTTLLPGTVILTGTPQGVGFAKKPPVYMKAGDSVTVEIDGIGQLTSPVAEGK
ncbi:MAG: fumarylacetoacetate hydrolase family protein [Phycisphaeraceae bacterium]